MFVKNLSKNTIEFRKNGRKLVLNPGMNLVNILIWDIEELRNTYGPTILAFIEDEYVDEPVKEEIKDVDNQPEAKDEPVKEEIKDVDNQPEAKDDNDNHLDDDFLGMFANDLDLKIDANDKKDVDAPVKENKTESKTSNKPKAPAKTRANAKKKQ